MKKVLSLTLIFLIAISGIALAQEEENEERVRAFKDFYFEDTRAEVKEKVASDDALTTTWVSKEEYDPEENFLNFNLQGYEYSMLFSFHNDQLYEVSIYSPSDEEFDYIISEHHQLLKELITNKYGEPTRTRDLSKDDIEEGYVSYSAIWENQDTEEDKAIKIGISLSSRDYEYSANLYLEYPPLVREIKRGDGEPEAEEQPEEDAEEYF